MKVKNICLWYQIVSFARQKTKPKISVIQLEQENYGQSMEINGDQIFWQTFWNIDNGDEI